MKYDAKINCDFSGVAVGDKVFVIDSDKTVDENGHNDTVYIVKDDSFLCTNFSSYLFDGRRWATDILPSCFWKQPEITIPLPPRRKVKKTIEFKCFLHLTSLRLWQVSANEDYSTKDKQEAHMRKHGNGIFKTITFEYEVEE